MKQYKFDVFIDNKVVFTERGNYLAVNSVRDFIAKQLTASFSLAVTANKKIIKGEDYPTWKGGIEETIKGRITEMLWQSAQYTYNAKVGDKGKSAAPVGGISVSWECTSGRAPARPKHVIAAEKAARAAKVAQRKEREAKWKKEAEIELANLRQRVKHQVDHAFALGKHGTEPAAKYITCQHCNAPAEYIGLKVKLSGAVVDEDTIAGVICKRHDNPYCAKNWGEKIPCSRLEFFYDGIRQIAIKP